MAYTLHTALNVLRKAIVAELRHPNAARPAKSFVAKMIAERDRIHAEIGRLEKITSALDDTIESYQPKSKS